MDPLSVTASVIAITQAVFSIGQGIQAFRSLNNASTELLSLLQDLISLQAVLQLLKAHISSQPSLSVRIPIDYPLAIQSLYLDLSKTTAELNDLAERLLASSKGINKKGLYHVSRISYLKEKSNIERLRDRSQVLQNNASSCLAAFNTLHGNNQLDLLLEMITSIETNLNKISHHQDQRIAPQLGIDPQLEFIKNKSIETSHVLQQGLLKLDALQFSIIQAARGSAAKSIASNEIEAYIPYDKFGGVTKQSHTQRDAGPIYLASNLSVQKCKSVCKCRCHNVLWAETPSFLQSSLGTMLFEYDGQSILYGRRCDNPICRAKSHSHIRFLYKFPLWWASRALMASLGWSTLTGLGASLWFRVPRMITFYGSDFTDLEALEQRFSRSELLPTDVEPNYGCNLLTAALNSGAYSFIPTLLQKGVDPRVPDLTGRTAVHLARQLLFMAPRMKLSETTQEMLLELIHFNADSEEGNELIGTSIIHDSVLGISGLSLEECILLQPSYINSMDSLGFTPLHWAAMGSDLDAVETLTKYGADPNCRDRHDGQTPLHLTCYWNWYEATSMLLDYGAMINVRDKMKFTPLHLSCGSAKTTQLLLSRGADPNSTTVLKATPLNHLLYVPNKNSVDKETNKMVFKALAEAGTDLDHKANDGCIPLFVAAMLKPWLVPTLLEAGATVQSLDGKGKCILHMLVATTEAPKIDDIQATLFIGLDPDLRDHQGCSPLELMKRRIMGQTIRRGLGEPTLGELLFFTSLICEIRELNWERSLFLDTKGEFEKNGSHALMKRWLKQQKERLKKEPEAQSITCRSLDMWWQRQGIQSQVNSNGKEDVEETEDEEFFEAN